MKIEHCKCGGVGGGHMPGCKHLPKQPDYILVIDTETNGAPNQNLMELAIASVDVATAELIEIHSWLFPVKENAAEYVNGIPAELTQAYGRSKISWGAGTGFNVPRAVVAHRMEFDRPKVDGLLNTSWPCPWLCTLEDWRWPKQSPNQSLSSIALAHGVPVTSPHRAFHDVLTLCQLLKVVHGFASVDGPVNRPWTLQGQLDYAQQPKQLYLCKVAFEDEVGQLAVRKHGFRWDPERQRFRKRLTKAEAEALPFGVYDEASMLDELTRVAEGEVNDEREPEP